MQISTVRMYNQDYNFENCVGFAADCYVEVEAQLYPMKEWNGDYSYGEPSIACEGLRDLELDEDQKEDVVTQLQEKVGTYQEFVENIEALLSASKDTLKGLEGALLIAENLEVEGDEE